MSELLDRLQRDLNAARKAQDKSLTLVLGTVLADVRNRQIELRRDPTDDDVADVVRKAIKRRRESVDMYATAGRDDLARVERGEVDALARYLPARASDDEVRGAIQAAIAGGATTIGAVMGQVLPRFKGRAEGSVVNAIAREELSKQG